MVLKKLFGAQPERVPCVPPGERVYAIGDIHGRLDCFEALLGQIERDNAARGQARSWLILLGDLVDRGPESRGVVERAIALSRTVDDFAFLTGNHEEILLLAANGDRASAALLDRVGGRETLLSYGVDPDVYDAAPLAEIAEIIRGAVPTEHLDFIADGLDRVAIGDYLFVHAGVRPKVAFADQKRSDLRWIREPFLSSDRWHGAMVVHGHTITAEPEIRSNRIGIDTGAFDSGRLTALGLEGTERWFLST